MAPLEKRACAFGVFVMMSIRLASKPMPERRTCHSRSHVSKDLGMRDGLTSPQRMNTSGCRLFQVAAGRWVPLEAVSSASCRSSVSTARRVARMVIRAHGLPHHAAGEQRSGRVLRRRSGRVVSGKCPSAGNGNAPVPKGPDITRLSSRTCPSRTTLSHLPYPKQSGP